MPAFTLHLPAEASPGDPGAIDRAEVVKDGFAWPVLVFQLFWFLWHRLWLGALAMLVAMVALAVLCRALNVSPTASFFAALGLVVFFALEGNAIRAWTLRRRGRPAVDVTVADDRDGAEARLIGRWLARGSAPAGPAALPSRPSRPTGAILGLFPEAEGGR